MKATLNAVFIFGAIFFWINKAQSAINCAVVDARYALVADRSFTVGFRAVPEYDDDQSLVLFVKSIKTDTTYWFNFSRGNGYYTFTYISPIYDPAKHAGKVVRLSNAAATEPLRMDYFSVSKEMEIISKPPKQNEEAPRYIFIPVLGMNLYYLRNLMGFGGNTADREAMPLSIFEYVDCSQ